MFMYVKLAFGDGIGESQLQVYFKRMPGKLA